ncbi:MAG: rRNA adenine N-6-methyltransferase family protein [Caldilineaceae bacterium]
MSKLSPSRLSFVSTTWTPRKSLGQNFLVDDSYLDEIVAAADLTPADTVLEIGPGLGTDPCSGRPRQTRRGRGTGRPAHHVAAHRFCHPGQHHHRPRRHSGA